MWVIFGMPALLQPPLHPSILLVKYIPQGYNHSTTGNSYWNGNDAKLIETWSKLTVVRYTSMLYSEYVRYRI